MIAFRLALPLLICTLLFSCQGERGKIKRCTQVLHLNIHTEPPTLDPRKASDSVSIFVIKQCQSGLMQRGHNGKPEPGLAERFEVSEDGKTYTFYLKEVVWSDGKPLTAHDFERSWKTLLDPAFASDQAIELFLLKNGKAAKDGLVPVETIGVKALSDKELKIDLEHPAPYFLSLITIHPFFPIPDPFTPTVSSGPFLLKKWRHFDELILEKNPLFWDAAHIRLERVHLAIIEDDQTELNLFENGELDWAGHPFSNLPTDALSMLKTRETIHSLPLSATYLYNFNTEVYPLNNAALRRALTLAINRQEIVDNVTQTGQIPTSSLVPPSMWSHPPSPYFEENLKAAQELFAQALRELGTTVEALPELVLSYNTMIGHHKIAQAIQQQWLRAFGFKVKLQNKEWKVFLDDVRKGNYHIARGGISANVDDPIALLDSFRYKGSQNTPRWTNALFTHLIEEAQQTKEAEARLRTLQEAERVLMKEMPLAPIYTYRGSFIKKPYVKNVYISELGDMDIRYAYIDHDDDTQTTSRIGFGLARKLPRLVYRKWVNIN